MYMYSGHSLVFSRHRGALCFTNVYMYILSIYTKVSNGQIYGKLHTRSGTIKGRPSYIYNYNIDNSFHSGVMPLMHDL